MRAAVVVLGDLARSPRTVLHAVALADEGIDVDLVGFADQEWRPSPSSPHLRVWLLPDHDGRHWSGGRLLYLLAASRRGLRLVWQLVRLLGWQLPAPTLVLVQNPPGVPTLLAALLAARFRRARFVIDWHNLTWSMLSLRVGASHPLVRAVRWYEGAIARRADGHLFVSKAMQAALGAEWGIRGVVFYDRPARAFAISSHGDRAGARSRVLEHLGVGRLSDPFMVVTSTSWSADEDFGLLESALARLDDYLRSAQVSGGTPRDVVMVITGRGPLRDAFERRVASAGLRHVRVKTAWLEADEYPRVLAAADLGVCVHRSSSGLDLPMKVLDMFGAGLPVCALNYGPCLSELVADGVNGLLFTNAEELASQMASCADPLTGPSHLQRLREGVSRFAVEGSWEDTWTRQAWPELQGNGRNLVQEA